MGKIDLSIFSERPVSAEAAATVFIATVLLLALVSVFVTLTKKQLVKWEFFTLGKWLQRTVLEILLDFLLSTPLFVACCVATDKIFHLGLTLHMLCILVSLSGGAVALMLVLVRYARKEFMEWLNPKIPDEEDE